MKIIYIIMLILAVIVLIGGLYAAYYAMGIGGVVLAILMGIFIGSAHKNYTGAK